MCLLSLLKKVDVPTSSRKGGIRKPVSVVVADRSPMESQLLAKALKRSRHQFEVLAVVANKAEASRAIRELNPSIALVSVDLEDGQTDGLELLLEATKARATTRTIVLLDSSRPDLVVEAFRCGAKGIFRRNESFSALCKCIQTVYDGQVWASSKDLESILQVLSRSTLPHFMDMKSTRLTRRENEVVVMVAEGLTNREIAGKMRLSEHTVKNYLFRVFEKLGLSSRSELMLYALQGSVSKASGKPEN